MIQTKPRHSVIITESAIMLALAVVLSMITIIKLPFGGAVTPFSMLPIILLSYRYGVRWGLFSGFVYSLIQMLLDVNIFSKSMTVWAVIAIALLDYILAFTLLGLAGAFKNIISSQTQAIVFGALLVCSLRFICHLISGCTVWAGVSIPSSGLIIGSLIYNSTYMVPETIVTVAGAFYISSMIDFSSHSYKRKQSDAALELPGIICNSISLLLAVFAVVFDALSFFASIQTESGYDITAVTKMNAIPMLIVTAVCVVLYVVLIPIRKKLSK